MPPLPELILGVIVPVAMSAVVLLVGFYVGKLRQKPQTWASPVAIATGLVAGVWVIQHRPPQYQPFQSTGAVVWLGLALAIVAGLLGLLKLSAVLRLIGVEAGGAGAIYFLKKPQLTDYSSGDMIALFVWAGIILMVWQVIWERVAIHSPKVPKATVPLAMTAVASGISILLLMSASMLLGRIGGSLAAAIGPVLFFGLLTDRVPYARAGIFIASLLTLGLLMSGRYYAEELPWSRTILVLACPLMLIPTLFGPVSRLDAWKRAIVTVLLVMLPILAAVAWATPTFLKNISESNDSAGY